MPVTMKRAQRRREYRDLWKRYCRDARRWPRIAAYWQRIFEDIWHARVAAGKSVKQKSPQEWYEWWCRDRHGKTDDTGVLDATT